MDMIGDDGGDSRLDFDRVWPIVRFQSIISEQSIGICLFDHNIGQVDDALQCCLVRVQIVCLF